MGEPQWWDEYAVPRYCKFAPSHVADIYADEVAFLLIGCQSCRREFKVAMSCSSMDDVRKRDRLAKRIEDGSIHYGDPPNADCCPGGNTMNCDDFKVLEYWVNNRSTKYEWERIPELEIDLPDMPGYEKQEVE
jgi:hypothetical protein